MNIIVASDSNYLDQARVLFKSITAHNAGPICAYVLHSGLSTAERGSFASDCAYFSGQLDVRFIEVDDAAYKNAPGAFGLPNTAYYRFEAPSLLPETVDRALYLDCDIIVNRPLRAFYDTPFEGGLFIACEDIGVSVTGKYKFLTAFARLEREFAGGKYFNSGVLLINMETARQAVSLNDALEVLRKHRNAITFADQDILNLLYGDRVRYADYRRYNMGAGYVAPEDEEWVLENSTVIHYYGARDTKPWLSAKKGQSENAMTRLWWKYAEDARMRSLIQK